MRCTIALDVPVCTSARTYMCLHACMHACIHQYETHTYTYLQQKMYLCMQARARTHTLTRLAHQRREVCRIIRNAMHNCIRYTHTYTHFYQVYTCTCTHFYQAYTCIFKTGRDVSHTSHTHTHTLSLLMLYISSLHTSLLWCARRVRVCVRARACMHRYIFYWRYVYVCVSYWCMHACMYACMHACMQAHIRAQQQPSCPKKRRGAIGVCKHEVIHKPTC